MIHNIIGTIALFVTFYGYSRLCYYFGKMSGIRQSLEITQTIREFEGNIIDETLHK
jgi:hypothetical protein